MARMSMFTASPFRPKGYNESVAHAHRMGHDGGMMTVRTVRMGGDLLDIFGDIIEEADIDLSVVENLLEEFDQLLTEVPVGALRDDFATRRDGCMEKSNDLSKYKCLYDLFQDVKRALKNGDDKVPTPTSSNGKKPENGFPWVPVGIAAGIGTAALLYLIFRPKTPANGNKKKK